MSFIEVFIFSFLFLGLSSAIYYAFKLMNELDAIVYRLKKDINPSKNNNKPSVNVLTALNNIPKNKP